jgi:nitrate/nitrite transport system ATP-binding protein
VLFLDEPFGALDALTREALQQELARLCSTAEQPVTTVMITNSVEEAILLADRIVPMTRGPRGTLLASIPVGLPRPRTASLLARDAEAARVRAAILAALTGAQPDPPSSREPSSGDQPVLSLIGAEGES